ncbi:MAG: barstar family protein [Bacillota bacterium]|nr:barstar family protein [Bacillota bacterium]MDW7678360.1 barstar family protein [Bacillota bacterium]
MRVVLLNGSRMNSRETAHETLRRRFGFPDYYGKNLDALYDLLSCEDRLTLILLFNTYQLNQLQDNYGKALIQTISEAAAFNHRLRLVTIRKMPLRFRQKQRDVDKQ